MQTSCGADACSAFMLRDPAESDSFSWVTRWAHSEGWATFLKRIISVRRDSRDVLQLHIFVIYGPAEDEKFAEIQRTECNSFTPTRASCLLSWLVDPNGAHLITFRDFLDFEPKKIPLIWLLLERNNDLWCWWWSDKLLFSPSTHRKRHPANDESAIFFCVYDFFDQFPSYFNYWTSDLIRWSNE